MEAIDPAGPVLAVHLLEDGQVAEGRPQQRHLAWTAIGMSA